MSKKFCIEAFKYQKYTNFFYKKKAKMAISNFYCIGRKILKQKWI